jgi:hypothetical protein
VLGGIKQSLAEINDSPIKNAVSAFDELNTKFLRLPQSEANAISRMIELGQRTEAVTRILADLAAQGGGSIQKIDQQVIEAKEDVQRAKDQLELLQHTAALPGNPESIYAIQEAALLARHEVDTLEASLKKLLGEQSARNPIIPIDASQVSDQLTRIAQDVQKTNAQILQDQVTYLKQEEQAHNLSASARHYIETTLQSKLVDLARKTSADNIETMHATENAAGLIGTARLNREIADDRKAIADKNTTAEDRLRLERELGDKLSQLHQLQFNAEKKLENDKHSWLQQLYDEQLQVMKTALKEEADAEKSAAQADLSIARSVLDQKKDILNRELTDFQITAQEKFQMEKQYAIEAEMAEEKAIMAEGLTAQQTYDKIRVLRAKLNTDLAKLDTQMEQESVHTWRDILAPIQTATTSIFSNIVTRAQTVGQLMRGVLQQLVLDFATARIKIEFDWLAGQAAMALGAQKWASKSLIEWVASELGIQTAKEETAATTESTDAALAASGATTAYLTAASQIATDAAVAGAGAYAATAMIPYVGPALAPGAAATAYAGALSFEGALALPALATGTMNVPQDMLAFIHEGESVVPKEFAQGLRESGSIFNNQRGGDINLHYGPHIMGDHQKSLTELLDDQPYALLDMLTRLNRNGALQQALR